MSNLVQVTPRKRKASGREEEGEKTVSKGTPGSGRRTRSGANTNPPIVPPTPPSSRHRKADPGAFLTLPTPKSNRPAVLPPHLETLLNLHTAVNLALSFHMATHPPVLPPHPASATSVPLPNLTNYLAIKADVERTSGRRFGAQELGRLAWVWAWDGVELPDEKKAKEKKKAVMLEEDNPFVVPSAPDIGAGEVSGLSYIISSTRTRDPGSGKMVFTHGLGIDLELRVGETRQLLPGSDGGFGNKGQGGGTGAIGRWSAGGEGREDVFRERLEKWVELNGGYEPPQANALPTPTTSDTSTRSTIPPIPILPLPKLPSSTGLPAANLFTSFTSPSSASTTPRRLAPPPTINPAKTAGLSDPFEISEPIEKGKVVRTGSVNERLQAMKDRIKAKRPGGGLQTLGSSVGGFGRTAGAQMSSAQQAEELKRRSTLSRLEGIAEGVYMMFSAPSPGPNTLPTPPKGRRRVIPLSEVAEVIVKSSKTPLSIAEAQSSLQLLTELCPFFLTVKTVGKKEWLEMPAAVLATAPPSPGTGSYTTSTSTATASPGSGSSSVPRVPPGGSPSTPARLKEVTLAGPASPGKVRRQYGLREVRERIRRELGE
ncbi:hypothetical protein IAT38_001501 [Cryptococcus sp. DSM 104549]